MIADDIDAIRAGIRKLNADKIVAEAEAAKRAAEECKPAKLPDTNNLFPEAGPPFRGFFVSEDGDIVPCSMVKSFGIHNGGTVSQKGVDDWTDDWDNVTLDGASFMWGQL